MKTISFALLILTPLFAAEKALKLTDLPAAVQAAVKEQSKDATIVGFSSEKEKGKTIYEAEMKVNGKGRDVSFDATGKVVSVEQEVELDSIPAAAKTAIQKKVGTAKITKVEAVTEGGTTGHEATYTKGGKSVEVSVNADGSPHKE